MLFYLEKPRSEHCFLREDERDFKSTRSITSDKPFVTPVSIFLKLVVETFPRNVDARSGFWNLGTKLSTLF